MNTLIFQCSCLYGNYTLKAEWTEEKLGCTVVTDIPGLTESVADADLQTLKEFTGLLEKANLSHWERKYENDGSGIEDAIRWKTELDTDGKNFLSEGEETFLPYEYETLIDALALLDPAVRYFSYR